MGAPAAALESKGNRLRIPNCFGLEAVADVYFTARGAAQIMDFDRQDRGERLLDGGTVEFLTARTSAFGFKSTLGAASARTLVDQPLRVTPRLKIARQRRSS